MGRGLPRCERAELARPQGLRAAGSGHVDEHGRLDLGVRPVQQRGIRHHVERFHAGQAVRSERDADAGREQVRQRRQADAEVPVAAGAEHGVYGVPGQQRAIHGVHLDAVRGHEPGREHPEAFEVLHRSQAFRLEGHVPEPAALQERRQVSATGADELRLVG
jgi:hypothetical protein